MKRYEAPTCQVIEMMGESLLAGSGDNEDVRRGRSIDLGDDETYTKSPSSVPLPTWLASLLAMLFVVSCGNDDAVPDPQPETKPAKVHLTFEAYPESGTRSALSGDGDTKQIIWNANDAISVLSYKLDGEVYKDVMTNDKFTLQSGDGTEHGTFIGEALEREAYQALYPYQEQATFDKGQFKNVVLPAVQTATAGTYDPHASLAVATCQPSNSQTLELKFRNVCSYVAITPEFSCKSITISGKSKEDLAGIISINYNNGEPTATVTEGSKTVTLVGDIQANETYYIAVLPQTLSGGFTVTVQDGDKYKRVGTTTAFTLARSEYHDVGIGAAPLTKEAFVDLGLSVKWATMNLNASAAEQPGNYYAWGEAVPLFGFDAANSHGNYKTLCSWESYKWSDGTSAPSITGGFNDAATLALGDGVSIPTEEQWQELIENCTREFTDNGYTITSKNGASIFLPLTGYHNDKATTQATETCYYWSSNVDSGDSSKAISLQLNSSKQTSEWRVADDRKNGFAIRPVKGSGSSTR